MEEKRISNATKTVRLNTKLINNIQKRAYKENRNFSNIVETILMEYYELTTPKD